MYLGDSYSTHKMYFLSCRPSESLKKLWQGRDPAQFYCVSRGTAERLPSGSAAAGLSSMTTAQELIGHGEQKTFLNN